MWQNNAQQKNGPQNMEAGGAGKRDAGHCWGGGVGFVNEVVVVVLCERKKVK